jgi:hypothetical protein
MSNAPSVSYSQKEPPLELRGLPQLAGKNNGYVSFGMLHGVGLLVRLICV